jgi:hypothetical protein
MYSSRQLDKKREDILKLSGIALMDDLGLHFYGSISVN